MLGVGTCADWLNRGGACKHLRALRISASLVEGNIIQYPFFLPPGEPDARGALELKKRCD